MKELLSKKRRDNDSRRALLELKGMIDAAISEGDCLEDMLRLWEAGGGKGARPYRAGSAACGALDPAIAAFRRSLEVYVAELGRAKDMLA